MISFKGGPAERKTLMLKRAPLLLRVVNDTILGTWDACDQLADHVLAGEVPYAYRRVGDAGVVHINAGRRKGNATGFWPMAEYSYCDPQPPEEVMRDNDTWKRWCLENR